MIPTTTYRAQPFVDAVQRLGVDVTIASNETSSVAGLNPTGLLCIDWTDANRAVAQVREFATRHTIDAVVPVDDQVTVPAAVLARELGLRHNSVESAVAGRDKFRMRQLLAARSVRQPRFRLCHRTDDLAAMAGDIGFPCVVKPLALAASRGVIRADDPAQFRAAAERLIALLDAECQTESAKQPSGESQTREHASDLQHSNPVAYEPTYCTFLVEDFVAGPEVALEGLMSRRQLRVLALFDKPDPLDGPYFEETIYVTPSRLPPRTQEAVASCTEAACRALGIDNGPIHAELRLGGSLDSATPTLIEVNARSIGGLCSRILRFGTGQSLEELVVCQALDARYEPPQREPAAAGVMMIPIPRRGVYRGVAGLEAARSAPGVEAATIVARKGQTLVPLPEGGEYLGFIFARGAVPWDVEQSLRQSHALLQFDIAAG